MTKASPVFARLFCNGSSVVFAGRTMRYIDLPGENAIVAYLVIKILHAEEPWVDLWYNPHLLGLMADFAHRFDCLKSGGEWFGKALVRCKRMIMNRWPAMSAERCGCGPLLRLTYLTAHAFAFYLISWIMLVDMKPQRVVYSTSQAGLTEMIQRRMAERVRRYHRKMIERLWPDAVRDMIYPLVANASSPETWPACRRRLLANYVEALQQEGAFFISRTLYDYVALSESIQKELPTVSCGHEACEQTRKVLDEISLRTVEVFRETRGVCLLCLENGDTGSCANCEEWSKWVELLIEELLPPPHKQPTTKGWS
ncbi:uncharacterized protein EI97DRAFT_430246 [Westerdykella ornata]|uniref:Uncharacterized protein n=1 Tax=Westerdykella ornata TaxID=318751 RepID=A0A6A6JVA0_WESOR|nr:uncharacterized protein EI97DRAFT_430246 [Westerdykella ornata]KAF2280541.1 hypothetical protein EI97DRAFT_430246 [Westerdykella ornata]